jgi:hypothetical protein
MNFLQRSNRIIDCGNALSISGIAGSVAETCSLGVGQPAWSWLVSQWVRCRDRVDFSGVRIEGAGATAELSKSIGTGGGGQCSARFLAKIFAAYARNTLDLNFCGQGKSRSSGVWAG